MSVNRELRNAQAALNGAALSVVHAVGMGDPCPDLEALCSAVLAWDQLRRDLEGAGAASARDTSIAAGKADLPLKGSVRREVISQVVLRHIRYGDGMTVAEICNRLRRPHQTVSSAVNFAEERGWLADSGLRRKTGFNRDAIVFEPTKLALDVMRDVALESAS